MAIATAPLVMLPVVTDPSEALRETDGIGPRRLRFPPANEGGEWKVSTAGGRRPHWSADGRALYYQSTDLKSVRAVKVTPGTVFAVGSTSTVLTSARPLGIAWDLDRATGRIVVTEPVTEAGVRIVVIQHWLDAFAKRASRPAAAAKSRASRNPASAETAALAAVTVLPMAEGHIFRWGPSATHRWSRYQ